MASADPDHRTTVAHAARPVAPMTGAHSVQGNRNHRCITVVVLARTTVRTGHDAMTTRRRPLTIDELHNAVYLEMGWLPTPRTPVLPPSV